SMWSIVSIIVRSLLVGRDMFGDGLADIGGGRLAAEIRRARAAIAQQRLDGINDGGGGGVVPQMLKHEGGRPDLADGVGDLATGNIGRRAVDGLEHGGRGALGIDV